MSVILRAFISVAACGLLALSTGCTQSNEDAAEIKGVPPADGGPQSQADYGAQMKGAQGGTEGYPGAQ